MLNRSPIASASRLLPGFTRQRGLVIGLGVKLAVERGDQRIFENESDQANDIDGFVKDGCARLRVVNRALHPQRRLLNDVLVVFDQTADHAAINGFDFRRYAKHHRDSPAVRDLLRADGTKDKVTGFDLLRHLILHTALCVTLCRRARSAAESSQ
jgi:hypothetical protein